MGNLGLVRSANTPILLVCLLIIFAGVLTESKAKKKDSGVTEWHGRIIRSVSHLFQKEWTTLPYMDNSVHSFPASQRIALKDRNLHAKSNQDSISGSSDDSDTVATWIFPGVNSLKRQRRNARALHCKRTEDKINKRGGRGESPFRSQCLRKKAVKNIRKTNLSKKDHTTLVHRLSVKSDKIGSKTSSKPNYERSQKVTKKYGMYGSKKTKNTDTRPSRKQKNKNPDTYNLTVPRKIRPNKNLVDLKGSTRKNVRPGNSASAFQNIYRKSGKSWRKPNRNFKNRKGQLKNIPYQLNKNKKHRQYGQVLYPRKKFKQKDKIWGEKDVPNSLSSTDMDYDYEVTTTRTDIRKDLNSENRNMDNLASTQMTPENLTASSTPNANEKQVSSPEERNLREYNGRAVEYDDENLTENNLSSSVTEEDSYEYQTDYDYSSTPEANKSKASKRISANNSASIGNSRLSEAKAQRSEIEENAGENFATFKTTDKKINFLSMRDDDTEKIKHALLPNTTSESSLNSIKSTHLFKKSMETTLSTDSDNSYSLGTDTTSSAELESTTSELYNSSSENSSESKEKEEGTKERRSNSSSLQELESFLNSLLLAKRNEKRHKHNSSENRQTMEP